MKGKFSFLSAAVLVAFTGGHADAAQGAATVVAASVTGSGDNGISLAVGLAEDNGDPSQCGTSTNLSATYDERVNFCYTVTNNSSTTLNVQTLVDDVSGVVFLNLPQTIEPGASFQYNRIVFVTASESPTATWLAVDQMPGYSSSAQPFEFIDITGSGIPLSLGDDSGTNVTLPFSFNFYGLPSNQMCVNNNGLVVFATKDTCWGYYIANPLPDADILPSPVLAPLWEDLGTAGNEYFATVGSSPNRQFVLEWANKDPFYAPGLSPGYTFELVLNESDKSVDFSYLNVVSNAPGSDYGAQASVGLQLDSTLFSSYSAYSPSIRNFRNIHWARNPEISLSVSAQVTLEVGTPILSLSASSLSASAAPGKSTALTLNIGNNGSGDLHWNLGESPVTSQASFSGAPKAATQPLLWPNFKNGNSVAGPKPAPEEYVRGKKSTNSRSPLGNVPAFGEAMSGNLFVGFNALDTGTLNPISTLSSVFYAGTFANNDFSAEYAVDYPTGNLYRISTATGATHAIGPTGIHKDPITGNVPMVSGIRWDATSDATYLISPYYTSSDCPHSTLYTLNLTNAHVQKVGEADGVCIADIAIDPSGVIYGVDILSKMTVTIDKTNGQVQFVGPTGAYIIDIQGMDMDPSTGIMYFVGVDRSTFLPMMYTIDTTSGAAALLAPIAGSAGLDAMAIAVPSVPCSTPINAPWLSENLIRSTTPPGASDTVIVTFDATSLPTGIYTANICVRTNEATRRYEVMPVTFNVADITDRIFAGGFESSSP